MASSNHAFELQAKADEWMDVTPTEEVLRNEISRLTEAFEKCTSQLDSARLENDLLRDRSTTLEKDNSTLRRHLDRSNADLDATQTELETARETSCQEILKLEVDLHTLTEDHHRVKEEMETLQKNSEDSSKKHQEIVAKQATNLQRLERELKSSKAETKTHKDAAIRFAEDLRTVREQHKKTQNELRALSKLFEKEKSLHSKAKQTLGTIATLAEDLKVDKRGLERSLAQEQQKRASVETESITLGKKLGRLERLYCATLSDLEEREKDLKASNTSVEKLQIELKDAEKELKEASNEAASLKAHLATMERGRHELLERRSELEEELADTHIDLRLVRSELVTHQEDLEGIIQERDSLRSEKAAYLQSHEREADLEEQLLVQKRSFEEQLRKLHAILGVTFTTVVHNQVQKHHRKIIQQMPKSLKMPLLHQQHTMRQQHVKSS